MNELLDAAIFSADKHRYQRRKNESGEPYIIHPLRVAKYLTDEGITNIDVVRAALLHDTLEDTETTYDELVEKFGVEVANIVKEVTDDKSLSKVERKKLQIVNAPRKSHEAKLVKLADKLDNLTDLLESPPKDWDQERVRGYFIWAYKVIEGLKGTNSHLEEKLDVLFRKVLFPDVETELEIFYQSLTK